MARGGRKRGPDLAEKALPQVLSPTLFLVGGNDEKVLQLNRQRDAQVQAPKHLVVISGATHLFEKQGALEGVARRASWWFQGHFPNGERG